MTEFSYDNIEKSIDVLHLNLSIAELAKLSEENSLTTDQMAAFDLLLEHLREKKILTTINTLLKMSRLPLKNPKTFDNFDFSIVKGKDIDRLKALPSLAAIHAHKNLAFIGPAGIGKTHLAQAFGYECCQHGLKTYFIKMSELRDKFTSARRNGKEASVLNGLVRPSCLIIDEVGHCEFDKENTRLFFDLIARRYNKEGSYNILPATKIHPNGEISSTKTMRFYVHWIESLMMLPYLRSVARVSEAENWIEFPSNRQAYQERCFIIYSCGLNDN